MLSIIQLVASPGPLCLAGSRLSGAVQWERESDKGKWKKDDAIWNKGGKQQVKGRATPSVTLLFCAQNTLNLAIKSFHMGSLKKKNIFILF